MGESFKAACGLLIIVCLFACALSWVDDQPNLATWLFRIGSVVVAAGAVAVLLALHYRSDKAPDYLYQIVGNYFNRGGFCFTCQATAIKGCCYLQVYFQNQYDQPCLGRIALQPARGFFGRSKIETVTVDVACEASAFGVAKLPIPIAAKFQGRNQAFEVGAAVEYPHGRGRRVRYRDGIFLRANADFADAFGTALAIGSILTGSVTLSKPATVTLCLPSNVAENAVQPAEVEVVTLWKLGDPPLKGAG